MSCETHVVIVQPPMVQLNTPYPSGAYLKSFFCSLKQEHPEFRIGEVSWVDAGNRLYHRIFSPEGLERIFSLTRKKALELAQKAEEEGRDNEAFNLRRYVAQSDAWIRWIPVVDDILCDGGRELCHEFARSPSVPRGHRMEVFLSSLEREPDVDDARILASLALADLADYIAAVFDSGFALVRYAESLASSMAGFDSVEAAVSSPVLGEFYAPVLDEIFAGFPDSGRILLCVSCPFPGTLAGALCTGAAAKRRFGERVFVAMGGGYVNTEFRYTMEPQLSRFVDALSFDRGYGSYFDFFSCLLDVEQGLNPDSATQGLSLVEKFQKPLFKLRLFRRDGTLDFHSERCAAQDYEDGCTRKVFPDYSGVDFSCYPRLADGRNPMHRLWSDGAWLKAYLAHGCYWHQCSFCDTTLDYVCAYRRVDVPALHESLYRQARELGSRGVHLVDEAAPPAALREFALANLRKPEPLSFWGNIRYEKVFSRDLADLLAHSGMTGVSGGIEIACGSGLDAVCKGTDIDSIVSSCAAFKEAGILTHAYMIYGYWLETPQILVDSMETLRQFFATGLVDSAFWHKFVLTRHSRIFDEWRRGLHPDLQPLDTFGNPLSRDMEATLDNGIFASNDIRFVGEERSLRYGDVLEQALAAWMEGTELERPVRSWFPFAMPKPSIPADFIEKAICRYENKRNKAFRDFADFVAGDGKGFVWLGGVPSIVASECSGNVTLQLCWSYMGEMLFVDLPDGTSRREAENMAAALYALSPRGSGKDLECSVPAGTCMPLAKTLAAKTYKAVRGNGLCRVF